MGQRNLQKMSYDATDAANLGSSDETVRSARRHNALNVEILERPAVDIEICGSPGTAFLDSAARTSLASPRLQDIFVKIKLSFQERTPRVVLATGNSEVQTVRTVTVPIKLKGRTFQTPFVCAQGGPDVVTLLGADFARIAGKNCIGFSWAIPLLLSMDQ
jgi:hypothetical protein